MEAIILAGGLGTRLKNVLPNTPKPLAPIGSRTFLDYILDYLLSQGVSRLIFAIGYGHQAFIQRYGDSYKTVPITYSVEAEPLGTGGAVKLALGHARQENLFIINGDTFFDVNLKELLEFHLSKKADMTLALKPMQNFDRYGKVLTNKDRKIIGFQEKGIYQQGDINGGIYVTQRDILESREQFPDKFSLETDFFEKKVKAYQFFGYIRNGFFIDIGIPQDYQIAQNHRELLQGQPG